MQSKRAVFQSLFDKESQHLAIYSTLLRHERNPLLRAKLRHLAALERKHREVWRDVLGFYGDKPTDKKHRLYPAAFLTIRFLLGSSICTRLLNAFETASMADFLNVLSMVPSVKLKGAVSVITDTLYNENFGAGKREAGMLSHIREIVFGMNDGLVEVLASVAGIVGIYKSNLVGALAGLIIGISGTLSMAVGAYLSSTSKKDVTLSGFTRLQLELEAARERAAEDLGKAYKSYKGLASEMDRLIKKLKGAGDPFYKLLERERSSSIFGFLGRVKELHASKEQINPVKDAAYVGVFYLVGAVIPITSFFIGIVINDSVFLNLIISVVAAGVAIAITAALIAMNTGESIIKRVSQSLVFSLAASGATFLIGSLVSSYLNVVI